MQLLSESHQSERRRNLGNSRTYREKLYYRVLPNQKVPETQAPLHPNYGTISRPVTVLLELPLSVWSVPPAPLDPRSAGHVVDLKFPGSLTRRTGDRTYPASLTTVIGRVLVQKLLVHLPSRTGRMEPTDQLHQLTQGTLSSV